MIQRPTTHARKNKLLVIVDPQLGEVRTAYDDSILVKIGDAIKALAENRDDFYICVVGIYDGSFSNPFIAHSLNGLSETLIARGTVTGHQLHPSIVDAAHHVNLFAGKMTADAFSNGVLNKWIKEHGIDEMYFCGLQCNSCVFFSATSNLIDTQITRFLLQNLTNAEQPYTSGARLKRDMDKFTAHHVEQIQFGTLISNASIAAALDVQGTAPAPV